MASAAQLIAPTSKMLRRRSGVRKRPCTPVRGVEAYLYRRGSKVNTASAPWPRPWPHARSAMTYVAIATLDAGNRVRNMNQRSTWQSCSAGACWPHATYAAMDNRRVAISTAIAARRMGVHSVDQALARGVVAPVASVAMERCEPLHRRDASCSRTTSKLNRRYRRRQRRAPQVYGCLWPAYLANRCAKLRSCHQIGHRR